MATVATAMAAVATAVAAIATAIAAIAAAVMTEGHHLAVTADEGDANNREKHRQPKNNNTVHPQILQLLTGTVSETTSLPSTTISSRLPTAQRRAATGLCKPLHPSIPKRSLLSKSTGCEGYSGRKG
jgi:bisphosphoglycerate-independent phosphoglycerate mutase (AlkP superfamily)